MLVLERKEGEVLWIGDAQIVISKSKGNRFRVAISAPRETKILRGELLTQDAEGNRENERDSVAS